MITGVNSIKVFVIGGGPAGEAAARAAAKKKAQVFLVEKSDIGGLCLNRGCIPSKTLLSFGKKINELKTSDVLQSCFSKNLPLNFSVAWSGIKQKKIQVIEGLKKDLTASLERSGVEIIYGEAQFNSPNEICISQNSKKRIEKFDKCVIAVGSRVSFPPPMHQFQEHLLDSDKVLELDSLPESMAIIGGGAIGCEFACLFHELGVKITLIEMTSSLLPGEDAEISRALLNSFEKRGIQLFLSATVTQVAQNKAGWKITLSNQKEIEPKSILVCTGRKPNFESLNLNSAGVQCSPSEISVNEYLQTSNPDIYAVGDVNGLSLLAHAGSRQGEIAATNALGERKSYDGQLVPRCLYTWPEVASVGKWKYEMESKGMEAKSHRFFFKASGRALAEENSEGFIQLVSDTKSQKIVGAQIIGPHATELIHILSVALQKEMSLSELKEVIFAHPTFSEGIRIALER